MGVNEDFQSNSFCGTHAYLAPEIVTRLSYGKSVDWYGLGAVLYEFCVGLPPYYQENLETLYDNIRTGPLQLPVNMTEDLKDLLKRLLSRIPTERLGNNGVQEIKSHPFFRDIDWSAFQKYNAQGGFDGIFVPRRKVKKFSKKKKQRAATAMAEIADDPGLRPELRVYRNIEDWTFVRERE